MESGTALTHAPKIGAFDFIGGKAAITFAGNTRSAEVTIQKFAKVLRRLQGHVNSFHRLVPSSDLKAANLEGGRA
jgi:hypothetical protein